MSKNDIQDALKKHLNGDGTMNDGTTDALYRDWYRIPEGQDVDLEDVEKWAQRVANR